MEVIDFSEVKRFFLQNGKVLKMKKNDYFVRQGDPYDFLGFLENGTTRYIRFDNRGKEHIVGYSFVGDFVSDYCSMVKKSNSMTSIQAVTDCTVYLISRTELETYFNTNIDTEHFGRKVAEGLFVEMHRRLLSFYCDTPEERYQSLIKRSPELLQMISLKEIASFIGVTPETVSHIRKK